MAFGVALAARLVPLLRGGGLYALGNYDEGVHFAAAMGVIHDLLPYREHRRLCGHGHADDPHPDECAPTQYRPGLPLRSRSRGRQLPSSCWTSRGPPAQPKSCLAELRDGVSALRSGTAVVIARFSAGERASVPRLSESSKAGRRSDAPIVMSFGGRNRDLLRSAPAQSAIKAQVGRCSSSLLGAGAGVVVGAQRT